METHFIPSHEKGTQKVLKRPFLHLQLSLPLDSRSELAQNLSRHQNPRTVFSQRPASAQFLSAGSSQKSLSRAFVFDTRTSRHRKDRNECQYSVSLGETNQETGVSLCTFERSRGYVGPEDPSDWRESAEILFKIKRKCIIGR